MADKPVLRVGFIGAGGISRGHFRNLTENPHAEVVALCDVSPEMIRAMVEVNPSAANCPVYTDWREMLDKEQLDGVQIHTPHTQHFEQAMEALDRGLHVLCEKPMVCRVDHAKTLMRKIEESGRVFSISYQRHSEPAFLFIKQVLDAGKIGPLHYIQAFQSQNWWASQKGKWRQEIAHSGGGQLNDSGSHLVDIVLWTSGLVPEEVFAHIDNVGTEVDILTAASIRFTNGALGTLSVIGRATAWWEDISWFGAEGALLLRNGELYEQNARGETHRVNELPKGSDPDTNWVATIRGEAENLTPPLAGLRTIQLTEAAWHSGASGLPARVVFDD
jgi:predicted dehydrogenase